LDHGQRVGPPERPDHYRLIRILGEGGEGQVWEAEEEISADRWASVALKIQGTVRPDEDLTAWPRYGSLLRHLDSIAGVVRVKETFLGAGPHRPGQSAVTDVDAGAPETRSVPGTTPLYRYVVMAYVRGETFRHWLDRNPDAPVEARFRALLPVASAVDAMHSGRHLPTPVVHGDIKPDNIILPADGSSVLVDLGATRTVDDLRRVGRTQPYAAPELFLPDAMSTPEADRFAFVATVVHAVLGHPPPVRRTGPNLDAVERQLTVSDLGSTRPDIVQALVRALRAAPPERPVPLADWLAAMLDETAPLSTPPLAPPPRSTPPGTFSADQAPPARSRRPPARLAAKIMAGVLLSILVGVGIAVANGIGPHFRRAEAPATPSGAASADAQATQAVEVASTPPGTAVATTAAAPSASGTPTRTPPPGPSPKPPTPKAPGGQPAAAAVTATMRCTPSCRTSERTLFLEGAIAGSLATDHSLMMFTHQGGKYFAGSPVYPSGGAWTGQVYVGNDTGAAPGYTYNACLYEIDRTFRADLDARGNAALNQGLDRVPTSGTAAELACQTVIWTRP
jgi:serine/threonine protein kinase